MLTCVLWAFLLQPAIEPRSNVDLLEAILAVHVEIVNGNAPEVVHRNFTTSGDGLPIDSYVLNIAALMTFPRESMQRRVQLRDNVRIVHQKIDAILADPAVTDTLRVSIDTLRAVLPPEDY
jgi:hypothetical protein